MPIELRYSSEALRDLDAIFWFIAEDSPRQARKYVNTIQECCDALRDSPHMGVVRNDLRQGLRIFPLRRRIVIAYELSVDRLDVLRIFSGGQDYEAIMGR